jgi:hypothetical protein
MSRIEAAVRRGGDIDPNGTPGPRRKERTPMRYLTLVHRSDDREPQELVDAFKEYLADIVAAGVFVDGGELAGPDGSHELRFRGGEILTTDGPFTEAKDIAGGYSMLECRSDEEAVAVVRRFFELHALHWPEVEITVQIRRIVGTTDIG